MPDVIIALRRELEGLEAELAADPRYRKITKIRELLAIYGPPAPTQSNMKAPHSQMTATPAQMTKADRIRSEIETLFQSKSVVHRKEMLDHLVALGVMGHENNPMASLAAYLTQMTDFVSHGGGNWGLRSGPVPDTRDMKSSGKVRRTKPDSLTTAINQAAAICLRQKGARAQAPEILKALQAGGLNVSKGTMSSALSHSPLFDNKRGEGYGLIEWSSSSPRETETPNSGELFGVPKGNGSSPLSP